MNYIYHKITMTIKYVWILVLIFQLMSTTGQAQYNCGDCSRRAILDEFTNPHNPDYEERLKQWNDCMRQYLGDREFAWNTLDPDLNSALENCRHLDPPEKWYCYPSIMSTYIGEKFTNPCFHLLSPIFYSTETDKPPEYIFKGSYEANLKGGRIIEYDENYKKPVIARMELRLYYNGNAPQLVAEWSSENTINDPRALFNKLNTPQSLSPVFEEFEKRPLNCDVETGSIKELCEKGSIDIMLTNFTDKNGATSKPFNRIMVTVEKGRILNGEDCEIGPDYKAFTLEEGKVTLQYHLPVNTDGDRFDLLRIYNSCDILPTDKYPLSKTVTDRMIVEHEIPIDCSFDAVLTLRSSYKRRQNSSYKDPPGGTCTGNGTFSLEESINASFYVPLRMEDAGDMPILNQRWEYYRPLDINLSSFNASIRTRTYAYLDCKGNGHRTTRTKNKNPVNRTVPEKDYLLKSNIILIIDKKTDKVVKIATGGFPVEFLWDETERTTGVEWSKEEGTKTINRSTHKTDDLATMFTAGPVEDPVPDPTFTSVSESLKKYMKDLGTPLPADIDIPEDEEKPEIEPDLLVKFGDGNTYFGGEGKKIIDNSEGSTVDREEFNFFWQVTRKKKQ
ncbi:MAG TPA: hypothetical protein VK861_00595 [Bacteroidales bacterium]|nr:hypothetical protein [Bacteroidales bacterium]